MSDCLIDPDRPPARPMMSERGPAAAAGAAAGICQSAKSGMQNFHKGQHPAIGQEAPGGWIRALALALALAPMFCALLPLLCFVPCSPSGLSRNVMSCFEKSHIFTSSRFAALFLAHFAVL